jgi:uncharacterized phage protein (TIGR02218 family)
MLLLSLRDGTSIGITDHGKDLDYNLLGGSVTYDSGTGIWSSDLSLSCGMDADNFELRGPIADTITLEGILGGKYDRATAKLFQVNWKDLTQGAIKLLQGNVSEARAEGGEFVFEIRSDKDRYNQTVGRIMSNQCDADHGDERCGRTPETSDLVITVGTSAYQFTATFTGTYPDDYMNKGTVQFLTGDLAGTMPVEIEDWEDNGDGTATVKMFAGLAEAPAVGDTATATRGCGKTRADCMARNNIVNFRGLPELPGSDQALRFPVPGTGGNA